MRATNGTTRQRVLTTLALINGVVMFALAFVLLRPKPQTMSWGEEIPSRESYVYVRDQTLTPDDLEHIASIKTMRSLHLQDCDLSECPLRGLTFASKELSSVDLTGCTGLWDLSFLSDLTVDDLCLADCADVDDLSLINLDGLYDLDVSGTSVDDLSPLSGSDLRVLSFARTEVSDIAPLAQMENLYSVDGSDTLVASLDALAGNEHLARVGFDGCPITEVAKPFAATYLSEVSLSRIQASDLSGLSGCKGLRTLSLGGNPQITDLSWLNEANYETLYKVDLAFTGLAARQIDWLRSCENLQELTVDGIELGNLDAFRKMRKLTFLSALACGVTDVSGLRGCPELETVLLGFNSIENARDIPVPDAEWPEMVLDLSYNQINSLADVPATSYRALLLQGNDLGSSERVPAALEANVTVVSWYQGVEKSPLRSFDRFSRVYMLGCPTSEYGTVDKAFSSFALDRVGEDELWYLLRTDGLDYYLGVDFGWYADYAEAHVHDGVVGERADGQ